MKRIGPIALGAAVLATACSLIVQFDPEGQPCSAANECLAGYTCQGGECLRNDGGNGCTSNQMCNTPGQCQHPDGRCDTATGRCSYPPLAFNSVCTDQSQCTQGDYCDGDGGCVSRTVTLCNTLPGPCYQDAGVCNPQTGMCSYTQLAAGQPCEDGNVCTVNETCVSAGGQCTGGSPRVCNTPPSNCAAPNGTCDTARGGCVYPPQVGATTCTDGNACTANDFCDAGTCVSGPTCPPPLPCQAGVCTNGSCAYTQAMDGVSCGPNTSQRCCSGNCVDISTSAANCGGCGIACVGGAVCESVAVQTLCSPFNPASTSGRCTCDAMMANTCPGTQNCRGTAPGINRCQPLDAGSCAPGQRVQTIASCPSYCFY